MPRRSDAKNKMIKTALLLFREKGYHGVGLAEILEQSGAPKGSFYHHFPGGKQELALAVLDAANRFMLRLIDNAFENAGTIEAAVDAVIDDIVELAASEKFSLGCPVTSFSVELTREDGEIRKRADTVLRGWVQRMVEQLEPFSPDQDELKRYTEVFRAVLTTIEGGWIVSQIQKSAEPLLIAKQVFRSMDKLQ